SVLACGTSAMGRPVEGSTVVNMRPSAASGRSPPMIRRCGPAAKSRAASDRDSGSVAVVMPRILRREPYLEGAEPGYLPTQVGGRHAGDRLVLAELDRHLGLGHQPGGAARVVLVARLHHARRGEVAQHGLLDPELLLHLGDVQADLPAHVLGAGVERLLAPA